MNIDFQERRIPIIKIRNYLIVSIQVDMHDKMAVQLQSQILHEIERTGAKGVLIDISVSGNGGLLYRPDAFGDGFHGFHNGCSRCDCGDATGGCHHTG